MSEIGKTKVWGRSYTTIPFAVRKILELENGDELEWILKDGLIHIKKRKPMSEEKDR